MWAETVQGQELNGVGRLAVGCQVGEDFADDRGEFEAVAGEAAGEGDVFVFGVAVDDEVEVGGVGVHADAEGKEGAVGFGYVLLEAGAEGCFIAGAGIAAEGVGIDGGVVGLVVIGEFEAGVVGDHGEAVVAGVGVFDEPDGEAAEAEPIGFFGPDPTEDLAGDFEVDAELSDDFAGPSAGGEDEVIGVVGVARGADGHAGGSALPGEDGFLAVKLGAFAEGEFAMGGDGEFRTEKAGVGVEDADVIFGELELGEALGQLSVGKLFVGELMLGHCLEGTGDDFAFGFAHVKPAGDVHEFLLGFGFELVPEEVGLAEEGNVVGVFEVGEADDAGVAVGGAFAMRDVELLEAQDAFAACSKMVAGGGAHGARAPTTITSNF